MNVTTEKVDSIKIYASGIGVETRLFLDEVCDGVPASWNFPTNMGGAACVTLIIKREGGPVICKIGGAGLVRRVGYM